MTHYSLVKLYLTFVVVKAFALAVASALLDITFWRALILLAVSATITGLFGLLIAREQSKENDRIHDRLDRMESVSNDIAGKVGADQRKDDGVT